MVRMACVNLPCFSLQLLVKKNPFWKDMPVVVVTEDKPSGIILEMNKRARDSGVITGMRYSAALTIEPRLHAGVVMEEEIAAGNQEVINCLHDFSPEIEPFSLYPGVFWVNAAGFERLYTNLSGWIDELQNRLEDENFVSRICIGFTRFGSFIGAKRAKHPLIFYSRLEEERYSRFTPLTLLPMSPKAAHQLKDLGIETVGAFISLPDGGVKQRFSKDICTWHNFASSKQRYPLQHLEFREKYIGSRNFQPEVKNLQTILHEFRELLDHLITDVMKHNELIHALIFRIVLESGEKIEQTISPAKPTVRPAVIYRLLSLRLNGFTVSAGITRIELMAERIEQHGTQELLFHQNHNRSQADGAEVFAMLRAELGNNSVQIARIKSEYQPENQFEWIDVESPKLATQNDVKKQQQKQKMVRRLYRSPISGAKLNGQVKERFPQFSAMKDQQLLISGGPYKIQTNWWERESVRDYYYLHGSDDTLHWVFYDSLDKTWKFQGIVS
ncbi:MAG: hypothetical protein CMN78_02680 [Spirochaetales bacterium]|nr:hypothetical protein [Spirochaetales bacterium]